MHFDPRGPSKYVQFADLIRHQIESGELLPGAMLPSESAFMRLYGVSRPLSRKAVQILRNEGLVTTEQGVGSRVRELPTERESLILEPNAEAIARMPNEHERVELELDHGVPVIEIHVEGKVHLHSADDVVLRAAPKGPGSRGPAPKGPATREPAAKSTRGARKR